MNRTAGRIRVPFDHGDGDRAPLMWGQNAIWNVLTWLPPGRKASLNQTLVRAVPDTFGMDGVTAVLLALVRQHDSLRTVVDTTGDTPAQVRLGAGALDLWTREAPAAEAAAAGTELAADLRAEPFDLAHDPGLRAGVVLSGGVPVRVCLALSHFAVDASSLRIVAADLDRLLAGRELGPRSQQPLERARHEAGPVMQRRQQRALEFWEQCTRATAATWLADLPEAGPSDRPWAELRSPALAVAVREIAAEHRLTTATVLQALISLTLALEHDETDVALRGIVGTRFTPETAELVGAFNLNAMFRLDLVDEPAEAFFARVRRAGLKALTTCECSQDLLNDAVMKAAQERGIVADGYCFFNDVRPVADPPPTAVEGARDAIGDLLHRTEVTVPDRSGDQKGAKFFVYVSAVGDEAVLTLCADRRFVAPDRFLWDLDWVAVTMWRTGSGPEDMRRAFAARPAASGAVGR